MNGQALGKAGRVGLFFLSIVIALALVFGLARLLQPSIPVTRAAPISVGLVTDFNTINDMGFNWMAYQGILRAQAQLGITQIVYTSTSEADYEPNLQECSLDGNALCIGVGFSMADAVSNTAEVYTNTKFAIVDHTYTTYPANLRGIWFASEEAAYLAGTLAGLMTENNVIGDIGGMEIPAVIAFTQGYQNGAICANPSASVLITYTNDFTDPVHGAQVAQQMISQGADVIFAAAGSTGVGAVLTATQSNQWGIGVDTDFYQTIYNNGSVPGANYLLSSVLKRVDNAVYMSIRDVVSNTFTAGTTIYYLEADGVGLAPFHETDASVPQSVKNQLGMVRRGILNGVIDVNSQECPHYLFLAMIEK